MRRFVTRGLALIGLAAALLIGGVSAYASNNASWAVTFSVATATSLVNSTANPSMGPVIPGQTTAVPSDTVTITSNDPSGVQLTAASVASNPESGNTPCVPQAGRTVPGSAISVTSSATTGGTGGTAGTPAAGFALSAAGQNLFSAVPTNTGSLTEVVGISLVAPSATVPNSNGCSYTIPVNYTLIAQ
jgi:hypothetical protein